MLVSLTNTVLLTVLLFSAFAEASILGISGFLPANWIFAACVIMLVLINRTFDPSVFIFILIAFFLLAINCLLNMPRLENPQFKALVLTALGLLPFGIYLRGLNHKWLIRITCTLFFIGLLASMVFWLADIQPAESLFGENISYAGRSLATGLFVNPNAASHFYLMALFLSLVFIRIRPVQMIMATLSMILIVLSYSRATLLSAVIGLFIYWLLKPSFLKNGWGKFKMAASGAALIVALFMVFSIFSPEEYSGLLQKITHSGFSYRLKLWELAWNYLSSDFLTVWFGQGVNTLALPLGEKTVTAHNAYLNTAANIGMFYLAVVLIMLGLIALRFWLKGDRTYVFMLFPMLMIGAVSSVLFEGAYGLWIGMAWLKLVLESPGARSFSNLEKY